MKKRFIALLLTVVCICSVIATPVSALGYWPHASRTFQYTTVNSVTPIRDEYSNWYRMNEVITAGQAGQTAKFDKEDTKSVDVQSSFSVTIPIKKVELSLGTDVTLSESVTTTVYGTDSRPLRSGESAAFYYRKHWIVYNVDYTVTTVTENHSVFGCVTRKTSSVNACEELKVPQKIDSYDRQWFFATAGNRDALANEILSNACGKEETYQVYLNRCPA